MLITNGTLVAPGIRRRTINRQVNLGPVSLKVVTIIIIAAAALIAMGQSTQWATKNYEVQKLIKEKDVRQKAVEAMQFEATRLQSLQAVTGTQASPEASKPMEQPDKINSIPGTMSGNL